MGILPRRVRVVSDGTIGGTHVELDDGTLLGGVKDIRIKLSADQLESEVQLVLTGVEIDISGSLISEDCVFNYISRDTDL